jgi:hypothetical protein
VFNEARALVLPLLVLVGCMPTAHPPPSPAAVTTTVRDLQAGQVVNGVPCLTEESPQHHTHVHLQILVDGVDVPVPAGIGIGRPWNVDSIGFITTGACIAWIHTHDTTGVVHIVTPEQKSFTLGQLFDVWGQPLGDGSALGYTGSMLLFVNGQMTDGDPRALNLTNFENILLELGEPPAVPPPALYDFTDPGLQDF